MFPKHALTQHTQLTSASDGFSHGFVHYLFLDVIDGVIERLQMVALYQICKTHQQYVVNMYIAFNSGTSVDTECARMFSSNLGCIIPSFFLHHKYTQHVRSDACIEGIECGRPMQSEIEGSKISICGRKRLQPDCQDQSGLKTNLG